MNGINSSRNCLHFGDFEADLSSRELRKNGLKIRLQDQPFQVLAMLLENRGRVVTREELRQTIWPADTFVDFDNSLNTAINKIREALGDSADKPQFVETLPRRGYRFLIPLQVKKTEGIHSLAVLPLENLSRDPEQEYFADGLTEALITNLAKIGALRVVSRTSAMLYKGARKPLREIASELGVDTVVEGTVQRSCDRVRISAQLIRAATDSHVWAESYERDLRDVLALEAEIARAVANEVRVKLTPQEQVQLASTHQVNPEAYEFYLKGRYHWNTRSPQSLVKSALNFQQAIDRDPNYAAAYAGLADSCAVLGFWGIVPPKDGAAKGKATALKAVALDSSLSEAYAALAFAAIHYDFTPVEAERAAARAVELDPRHPLAVRALAISLMGLDRFEEALQEAQRGVEMEPYSIPLRWLLGAVFYLCRQYSRAAEHLRIALDMDSNFAPAHFTIAFCYVAEKKFDVGIASAESAVRTSGGSAFFLSSLGHAYASAGRVEDLRRVLSQLKGISRDRYVSPYCFGWAMSPLEEMRSEALQALEAARREHAPFMMWAKSGPWFDNLRPDPRFQDLVRRLNFIA